MMLSDVRLSVAYIGPTACCYYYYGRCEFLSLSLYLLEEPPPHYYTLQNACVDYTKN